MKWTSNLAYAVGLLTTDGNLSKDGRHLELTSKDIEQLNNFKKCLGLKVAITWKTSGYSRGDKKYPRVQFGNVRLYKWLLKIGLMPNKTKIISNVKIPDKYFFDFLRGHFDGDGYLYFYFDKRWKKSFLFYLNFISASPRHISWLRFTLKRLLGIKGHLNHSNKGVIVLRYAKTESKKILKRMYFGKNMICLQRKYKKVRKAFKINAEVEKLVNSQP